MGQLAQAAQGRQLQAMNPAKQMKQLLEKSWPRIMAVMPKEMSAPRLYQMYLSTINREKELANCTVESVLSCFMRCTSLGLEPSNVNGLGMAYILPFGNKNYRTGQKEATFILGYKGILELARRSGQIRDISARVVHEGDEFEYSYGLNEDLRHVPCAHHGKLTHVYMIANFKDGGHYFKVMNADEIKQAMQRSPSARKQNSPWHTDFEAMAMKTVIRRSAAFLPLSVETKTAIVEDEATPDYSDVFKPLPDTITDDEPVAVDAEPQDESPTAPEEPADTDTTNDIEPQQEGGE
ncbi:DNA-binding protein [Bifidobacterium sp. UTCIF-37]|uniref:recombinase RecT n=1 Tax=unclassified Bifidobacterium TaxID=2608897 RepID=UPI00112A9DA4|nr:MULTISPECIES: recombinase RecT [unclassified Bifidobacterium]TPF87422.1 DNA-binding protein [Bifidobacterium sp. UTCIF-37]TPF91198.1 DNA-binding protein [Bifidobacterium sp. UTCIF-38]